MRYDYKCEDCKEVFEVEAKIQELGYDFPCPKCKSSKTKKIITSAPQIQFKGKGFYINDHKKG